MRAALVALVGASCTGSGTTDPAATSSGAARPSIRTGAVPSVVPSLPTESTSPSLASALPLDGTWLAYQTYDGVNRIRVATSDGSVDRELAEGSHPDWSPDGQWIAYEVNMHDIWVVKVDGSERRRVFGCTAPCL
ncbi:MAG: hypothetical protein ABIV26_06025, partial [Candidatus Limnocylindrales bacterium]